MNRRQAIQQLVVLSAGLSILPSCEWEEAGPVYANVPLERGERTFIETLSKAILPTEGTPVELPEKTVDFILTILNDCTAPADVQRYLTGLKEFRQGVEQVYNTRFKKIDPIQQVELFETIDTSDAMTDAARHFFQVTNGLARQQFATSAYFMKNVQNFEFAPGRYIGCRAV